MKILYIGNDLAKRTNYNSSMNTLSELLEGNGFVIYRSSSKANKVLRILDMLYMVFSYRKKVSYVFIDTFSTLNFYYALFISQLSRLLKLKYIPILHGGNLPYRLKKNNFFSSLIFENSHINVAPSNYLKTEFDNYGFTTEFIPNILEIENYKFKIRNSFQPKLLWVRAFDKIYNPTLAILVLKKLKNDYPNSMLTMVGPVKDDSYSEVIKLIDKLKLNDSVKITGVLKKEVWHKISADSDIFINTTNIDNTPVSVMESMALGLPVVSTDVGGLPYLINNNIDGLLVEKNNPELMCNAINHLLTNNNSAITIANNARKKAESFSWNDVKKKWLEILK